MTWFNFRNEIQAGEQQLQRLDSISFFRLFARIALRSIERRLKSWSATRTRHVLSHHYLLSTMARSNARAGPSQPSQTQRTRAGRVRIEDEEEEEEEENNDNEDDEEEEVAMAMDVDHDDEPGSVRYRIDVFWTVA